MANQNDLSGANKVLNGCINNGNPNHYRNVKSYTKNAGSNGIIAGILIATVSTLVVTYLDWLVKPIERPRTNVKPYNKRRH